MTSTRVSELAKELEMTNDVLMTHLKDLGVAVPGPAAMVEADTAQTMREIYGKHAGSGKVVEMAAGGTVKDLATAMGIPASEVQKNIVAKSILGL